MKKTNIIIAIVAIILVAISWTILLNGGRLFSKNQETELLQIKTEGKVDLIIDSGDGSPLIFNIELKEGETAFSLLKEKSGEIGLILETKTYDIGTMIEKIGDKKNGDDGKYWLYYLNGEMPQISADKYLLKIGDIIEFKFKNSPF